MVKKVATAKKAVQEAVEISPAANNSTAKPALQVVSATTPTAPPQTSAEKNLYVKVTTTDYSTAKGKVIGDRIVDMYHFGTKNWMGSHLWWATHNGHLVEIEVASDAEVSAYLAEQKLKLAEKFNTK